MNLHGFKLHLTAGPVQKSPHQHGDIFGPFPQGRHCYQKNVEPVIEVLPEAAVPDPLFQILVGQGQDSYIRDFRHGRAHGLGLLVLEEFQQLGLGGQGNLPDFIQDQSTLVCGQEKSIPVPLGPCKRTFDMAEIRQQGDKQPGVP